jgi:hypothetical protein
LTTVGARPTGNEVKIRFSMILASRRSCQGATTRQSALDFRTYLR